MRIPSTSAAEEHVGLSFVNRPGASARSPLVALVHGRAGNREVMWSFDRCIPKGVAVVSFQAHLPDPIGGFSWWDFEGTESKREAISAASKRVSYALERFIDLEGLAPSGTVALGFSQGAVLLASGVLLGDLALDGLGLLAGFAPRPDGPAAVRGHPKVFIAHGTKDEVISIERARHSARLFGGLGLDVTVAEDDVGHKVGIEGTRALKTWLFGVLGEPHELRK